MSQLRTREQEIIRLVAQGMTQAAAARELGLAYRTAVNYLYNARQRTDTNSTLELAVKCELIGTIED